MLKHAYAKINLTLELTGKLENGYHTLSTLMHKITLCDDIELSLNNTGNITVTTNIPVCNEKDNLAYKAAKVLLDKYNSQNNTCFGANIVITKRIPFGAGLGGGSADCACVIDILNEALGGFESDYIEKIAASLGADVPFMLEKHKFCLATGTGTQLCDLEKIDTPLCVAIVKPKIFCGTKDMYCYFDNNFSFSDASKTKAFTDNIKNIPQCFNLCCNDFEKAAFTLYPEIKQIIDELNLFNPLYAGMTGSGSAIFAIFETQDKAQSTLAYIKNNFSHIVESTFNESFV